MTTSASRHNEKYHALRNDIPRLPQRSDPTDPGKLGNCVQRGAGPREAMAGHKNPNLFGG